MTAQSSSATARKRVPGRPFVKGDPRINRGGRRPNLLTAALDEQLTPQTAREFMKVVLQKALAGESWALQMVWDRHEGKAINRNESGEAGAFTGLEDKDIPELIQLAARKPA